MSIIELYDNIKYKNQNDEKVEEHLVKGRPTTSDRNKSIIAKLRKA